MRSVLFAAVMAVLVGCSEAPHGTSSSIQLVALATPVAQPQQNRADWALDDLMCRRDDYDPEAL